MTSLLSPTEVRASTRAAEFTLSIPTEIHEFENVMLDCATREVFRDSIPIRLTKKEFDLLELLISNPRRVLTHDLILERVWGYDFNGETNVLAVLVNALRRKLGAPLLIQTIRGVGYSLRESVE